MRTRRLRHGQVELALHTLRDADGPCLLVLHELGGASPEAVPGELAEWRGSVSALDFTGHGQSTVPRGGGYTAEILMADADAAVAELGSATVVGYGIGAYVALLLAGSRPKAVRGAVLCDGVGLAGGGERGVPADVFFDPGGRSSSPDPFAMHELSGDPRPSGYVRLYARQATRLSGIPDPISVAAQELPPWLSEVLESQGVTRSTIEEALARYASSPAAG